MHKQIQLHPLLFAIAPIFFLYSKNISEVTLSTVWPSIVLSLSIVILLCIILGFILKNRTKAAILISIFVVAFYSFGHFYDILNILTKSFDLALNIARFRYIILFYGIALALLVFLVFKTRKNLEEHAKILNVIAGALCLISIYGIFLYKFTTVNTPGFSCKAVERKYVSGLNTNLPDIYYIILDAYAGFETTKEILNYDNSKFADFLTEKGFYVALKSRSNYNWTPLSLASSLNMKYINYLTTEVGKESNDITPLNKIIQVSDAMIFLKSLGYKFINFSSGWGPTDAMRCADINISDFFSLNEFNMILIQTTMLRIFDIFRSKRNRVLRILEKLPELYKIKEPKFILAHIPSPHPPGVFGKKGEPVPGYKKNWAAHLNDWEHKDEYLNELIFITGEINRVIKAIIQKSDVSPIILLQSDHGTGFNANETYDWISPKADLMKERTSILNSFYIKKDCQHALYQTITPVNSFRVVLNCYFGQNFDLLADKIYWAIVTRPYKLKDITAITQHSN